MSETPSPSPTDPPVPAVSDFYLTAVLNTLEARHARLLEDVSATENTMVALHKIRRVGEPLANPVDGDTGGTMSDSRRDVVWAGCVREARRLVGRPIVPPPAPPDPPPGSPPPEPPAAPDPGPGEDGEMGGGGGPSGQG